jgi:hypothetical protein
MFRNTVVISQACSTGPCNKRLKLPAAPKHGRLPFVPESSLVNASASAWRGGVSARSLGAVR